MYVLKPNRKARGFRLMHKRQQIFQTINSDDVTQPSSVLIDSDTIEMRHHEETSEIFKNGNKIGIVSSKNETDYIITLYRLDGSKDFFKLSTVVFSHYTLSSVDEDPLLKFNQMASRLFFFNDFKVEVLSDLYPPELLEELMFYAGEIIYKRVWDDKDSETSTQAFEHYRKHR